MMQRIKKRTFAILERAAEGDRTSRAFDIFIVVLIALNVLAVIFGTWSGYSCSCEGQARAEPCPQDSVCVIIPIEGRASQHR